MSNDESLADDEDLFGDLDIEATDIDVTGGLHLPSEAKRRGPARGLSSGRVQHLMHARGGAPRSSVSALERLAKEREAPAQKPDVIISTQWLQEDKKRGGSLKRCTEAEQGQTLWLETMVNRSPAPDGTEAKLEVFQHLGDRPDTLLTTLDGKVEDGRILVEWPCELQLGERSDPVWFEEPTLTFKVYVADDEARSPIVQVRSIIDVTCVDRDEKPLQGGAYTLTLPQGRERRGTLDETGRIYLRVPPGQGQLVVHDEAPPSFIEFTCVDKETGDPIVCDWSLELPDGSTRRGTTDDQGHVRIDDVPAGSGSLRLEERPAAATV